MGFELELVGIVQKQQELRAFIAEIDDFGPLWERYAEIMVETETLWFQTLGGGTWDELAESTVEDKARYAWPEEPMIRQGGLFESLTNPAEAMSIAQGRTTTGQFTRKAMTWGTSTMEVGEGHGLSPGREFAHYHQHTLPGSMIPFDYGDRPPERQVIPDPLPESTIAEMDAADEQFMADVIRRSGLS